MIDLNDKIKKATIKVNFWTAIKYLSKKQNRLTVQKKIVQFFHPESKINPSKEDKL